MRIHKKPSHSYVMQVNSKSFHQHSIIVVFSDCVIQHFFRTGVGVTVVSTVTVGVVDSWVCPGSKIRSSTTTIITANPGRARIGILLIPHWLDQERRFDHNNDIRHLRTCTHIQRHHTRPRARGSTGRCCFRFHSWFYPLGVYCVRNIGLLTVVFYIF